MKHTNNWWRKPFAFHTWKWHNWLALFCVFMAFFVVARLTEGLLFHNSHSLNDTVGTAAVLAASVTLIYYFVIGRMLRP